jgi:hypothetical protein
MHWLRLLLLASPLFACPYTAVYGGEPAFQQLAQFQMPPPDRPVSSSRAPAERPQPQADRVVTPPGPASPPRLPPPQPSPSGPQ